MKEILEKCMDSLAKQDLIFSNEQDFQFALALELKKIKGSLDDIQLEVMSLNKSSYDEIEKMSKGPKKNQKLGKDDKEYTDIIVKYENQYYAIELKYKTPDKICYYKTNKGSVITMKQGCNDINTYLYLEDITRLENINKREFPNKIKIKKGYAILLTNNKKYRYDEFATGTKWEQFSINEASKTINKTMKFNDNNKLVNQYVTKNRNFHSVGFNKAYDLDWHDYELKDYKDFKDDNKSECPGFSYLLVEVKPI